MVINGKLRFALAFQEPVGMTFRNSAERNGYLMGLRQQVDRSEATVWWNIKSQEYESCMRNGGAVVRIRDSGLELRSVRVQARCLLRCTPGKRPSSGNSHQAIASNKCPTASEVGFTLISMS